MLCDSDFSFIDYMTQLVQSLLGYERQRRAAARIYDSLTKIKMKKEMWLFRLFVYTPCQNRCLCMDLILRRSNASIESSNASTSKPFSSKVIFNTNLTSGSSSTTKILFFIVYDITLHFHRILTFFICTTYYFVKEQKLTYNNQCIKSSIILSSSISLYTVSLSFSSMAYFKSCSHASNSAGEPW